MCVMKEYYAINASKACPMAPCARPSPYLVLPLEKQNPIIRPLTPFILKMLFIDLVVYSSLVPSSYLYNQPSIINIASGEMNIHIHACETTMYHPYCRSINGSSTNPLSSANWIAAKLSHCTNCIHYHTSRAFAYGNFSPNSPF